MKALRSDIHGERWFNGMKSLRRRSLYWLRWLNSRVPVTVIRVVKTQKIVVAMFLTSELLRLVMALNPFQWRLILKR